MSPCVKMGGKGQKHTHAGGQKELADDSSVIGGTVPPSPVWEIKRKARRPGDRTKSTERNPSDQRAGGGKTEVGRGGAAGGSNTLGGK